jgi:hypothetical protein
MLFHSPHIVDWNKIGEFRQRQTDCNTNCVNKLLIGYNYKVGNKVLEWTDGILRKVENPYHRDPWSATSAHTNGTTRVTPGTKSERMNIQRVTLFFEMKYKIEFKISKWLM